MKIINPGGLRGHIIVELSERNLRTLLNKLQRDDSVHTLERWDDDEGIPRIKVSVVAVLDADHYSDREPGDVFPLDVPDYTPLTGGGMRQIESREVGVSGIPLTGWSWLPPQLAGIGEIPEDEAVRVLLESEPYPPAKVTLTFPDGSSGEYRYRNDEEE